LISQENTVSIDVTGVGRLMEICVKDAREVNPKIKLGICGEHPATPTASSSATNSA
jgi:pyruvate,orthophosphate dikinase